MVIVYSDGLIWPKCLIVLIMTHCESKKNDLQATPIPIH